MSYILDALRRADAERERGAVPGLNAQPVVLGEMDVESRGPARRGAGWIVGVLVLFALAAVAWFVMGGGPGTEPPRVAGGTVVPAPVSEPGVPAAPMVAAAPIQVAPVVVAAAPPPQAVQAPPPVPASAPKAVRKPPKAVSAAPARTAPTVPASSPAAPADPRVYQLSELPDDIRRELPALAIGGAMYSQNPANRMLIVNGQTFHEGDKLGPNLSLEQIRLKSAMLEYKGYRYRINY